MPGYTIGASAMIALMAGLAVMSASAQAQYLERPYYRSVAPYYPYTYGARGGYYDAYGAAGFNMFSPERAVDGWVTPQGGPA